MFFKNFSLNKKVGFVTVLGFVLLLTIGWFSYSSTSKLFKSFDWVYHTHQVLEKIGTLTNQLTDVQRSTRGYVITGDKKYLEPYQTAIQVIPTTLSEITYLTQDNPRQQKNLILLKLQIDTFIHIYSKVVQLRKAVGEEKIAIFIKKGTGLNAMNAIMKTIDEMNQEENNLLILRNAEEIRRARDTRLAIFIVTLLAAITTIGGGININRQIKTEKIINEKLREKDATISQFLESLPIGVFVVNSDGKPYYVNRTALNILGQGLVPEADITKLREVYKSYVSGTNEPYPIEKSPILLAFQGKKTNQDDLDIHQPDGKIVPIEASGTPIYGNDGKLIYALTAFTDISERKKYQAELKNLSIHDELTGLFNRRGFMTLANQQLKMADRSKTSLLMLFIDLDGLKRVNDSMGHQTGDEMIMEFARIINGHFRKVDIVARMGGDEFAILAEDKSLEDTAIIQRLLEKIEARNASSSNHYRLDFSVGSALYDPANPCGLDKLISLSDKRMYEEKKKKKNNSVV